MLRRITGYAKDRECALGAEATGGSWQTGCSAKPTFKCMWSHDGLFNTFAWGTTKNSGSINWEFKARQYTNGEVREAVSANAAKNFQAPSLSSTDSSTTGRRERRLQLCTTASVRDT